MRFSGVIDNDALEKLMSFLQSTKRDFIVSWTVILNLRMTRSICFPVLEILSWYLPQFFAGLSYAQLKDNVQLLGKDLIYKQLAIFKQYQTKVDSFSSNEDLTEP